MSTAVGAQINFGDLTPYLTYDSTTLCLQIGTQRYTEYRCAIDQVQTFSDLAYSNK
jgi:hypothetical protein